MPDARYLELFPINSATTYVSGEQVPDRSSSDYSKYVIAGKINSITMPKYTMDTSSQILLEAFVNQAHYVDVDDLEICTAQLGPCVIPVYLTFYLSYHYYLQWVTN